jgi:hypothetical protein
MTISRKIKNLESNLKREPIHNSQATVDEIVKMRQDKRHDPIAIDGVLISTEIHVFILICKTATMTGQRIDLDQH